MLSKDQTHYERNRYKMLDIIGEIGGLISILFPILALFLEPCLLKKHKLKVFKEYQNYVCEKDITREKLEVPSFFRLKLFMFNLSCISPCLKGYWKETDDINTEID